MIVKMDERPACTEAQTIECHQFQNQQLSLAVGIRLLNRLAAGRGRAMSDAPDSQHAFPDPEDLASL